MSRLGHPRVITHNVSSLDGRLSLPGVLLLHGDQRWSAIAGDAATDMWALHQPLVNGCGWWRMRHKLSQHPVGLRRQRGALDQPAAS